MQQKGWQLVFKKSATLFFVLLSCWQVCSASATDKWNTEKSTHFIVFYKEAKEDFIRQLLNYAESYYDKIAENLGLRRYDFWLWDNRAKIYIYNDSKDYIESTHQPVWSAGYAQVGEKTIYSYPYAKGFFETVLPHEMGHIIFRETVGLTNPAVPLWLEEGVAIYQENSALRQAGWQLKQALRENKFISFKALSTAAPSLMKDDAEVSLFYLESLSLVDYLIKEFGRESFLIFCQRLKELKDFRKALSTTYPFADTQSLGEAWEKYLLQQ
ncbi:MAG: peptidase MA family metallohydrolase [Candidatus Omnitrophica bacterium]|jgi:hypothetical protein|nr:peptidase MA family metallohydrolase [Candidatus Omnitrophota bacterium]